MNFDPAIIIENRSPRIGRLAFPSSCPVHGSCDGLKVPRRRPRLLVSQLRLLVSQPSWPKDHRRTTEGSPKDHWGVARSDAFYQRLCSVLFVEQVSIHADAGGAHEYDENTWEDE